MRRLMGIEIELGITHRVPNASSRTGAMATTVVRRAGRDRPHLPHASNGVFFDTGDRFYVDQGSHPEWCTPECSDMTDVVHHVRAAEAHLEAILREMPEVLLLRSNIDYASRSTWGCHESHLHRVDPEQFEPVLVPHLVSRIIFTGAGGLNPYDPGIAPSLSPRAMNFWRRSSGSRVSIYDMRDEPLAGLGYKRCHIVLGDTLCTDLALWLRLGTTSLIIAMAEAGAIGPRETPQLENAVAALHAFCVDPSLSVRVPTATGDSVTAIDVQRGYLRAAEAFVDHDAAPEWAAEVCTEWRTMLERLQNGPDAVATTCEWAIKRAIFEDQASKAGFDADRLERLGRELQLLQGEIVAEPNRPRRPPAETRWSIETRLKEIAVPARAHGVDLDELAEFLRLRQRLCEVDVRYGQLPDGIFGAIADALDHAAPRVNPEGVRRAMANPPRNTRATLRGGMIRELSPAPAGIFADWMRIDDRMRGRSFVMPDPFGQESEWKTRRLPAEPADRMLDTVSHYYNRGNFHRVSVLLRILLNQSGTPPEWAYTYSAWIDSRTGHVMSALRALEHLTNHQGDEDRIVNHVSVYRFQGLTPDLARLAPWIERGERADQTAWHPETRVSFLGHKGYVLSRGGRLDEAVAALRSALEIPLEYANHLRLAARIRCDLADCLRLLGQQAEALEQLEAAERIFVEHGFRGDYADHWAPVAVKLAPAGDSTMDTLSRAYAQQRRVGHPVGAVRTLLLRARLTSFRAVATRGRRQVERVAATIPDLRCCPLLKKILERWDEWALGYPEPVVDGDPFWLL